MKDYTKYDFAAIVGMKVEITTKSGKTTRGTLIDFNFNLVKAPIYIHESGACVTGVPIAEIESLSAKIKVEDMSVKQMMEFCFREGDCNYVVLYNDKTCIATCGKHAKNIELTDYIDCTDWGWKHE